MNIKFCPFFRKWLDTDLSQYQPVWDLLRHWIAMYGLVREDRADPISGIDDSEGSFNVLWPVIFRLNHLTRIRANFRPSGIHFDKEYQSMAWLKKIDQIGSQALNFSRLRFRLVIFQDEEGWLVVQAIKLYYLPFCLIYWRTRHFTFEWRFSSSF